MATDTTSTNIKDSEIRSGAPTTKYGAFDSLWLGNAHGTIRSLISFTLPSLSGTITGATLYMPYAGEKGGSPNVAVHQMTTTDWVEADVTWNKKDSTTDWGSAGGDFSGTVIYTHTSPGAGADNTYDAYPIMGGGASNPLSLSFGDTVHLLLKVTNESTMNIKHYSRTPPGGKNAPYLEITYTAADPFTPKVMFIM